MKPRRIDRSYLLFDREFWGVFLYHLHVYEDLDWFGVSDAAWSRIEGELIEGFDDSTQEFNCYTLRIPLEGGCSVAVDIEALPEDWGVTYSIDRDSWDKPVELARIPGPRDFRPFRWKEVLAISDSVRLCDSATRGATSLLLLTGTWLETGDIPSARSKINQSLRHLRVLDDEKAQKMAEMMIDHFCISEFDSESGQSDDDSTRQSGADTNPRTWEKHPEFGWINNSYSIRNPQNSSPEVFARISAYFDAIRGH